MGVSVKRVVKGVKMVGSVAKCSKGIIGVICSIDLDHSSSVPAERKILYKGVTLDGKDWQSRNPTIVSKTINEYFDMLRKNEQERV